LPCYGGGFALLPPPTLQSPSPLPSSLRLHLPLCSCLLPNDVHGMHAAPDSNTHTEKNANFSCSLQIVTSTSLPLGMTAKGHVISAGLYCALYSVFCAALMPPPQLHRQCAAPFIRLPINQAPLRCCLLHNSAVEVLERPYVQQSAALFLRRFCVAI
jgi:hypothetical protein